MLHFRLDFFDRHYITDSEHLIPDPMFIIKVKWQHADDVEYNAPTRNGVKGKKLWGLHYFVFD